EKHTASKPWSISKKVVIYDVPSFRPEIIAKVLIIYTTLDVLNVVNHRGSA
uniref:Uncharacterized protein n=1 Tax=Triticum urartu TaxID=4572 RepID=A0A8R7QTB2_TRIUA